MIDMLTATPNLPFAIALGLMLFFAFMELISFAFGFALSGMIDSAIPDFDTEVDIDLDADIDIEAGDLPNAPSFFTALLGWLCVGKVPALILLVFFLTAFGLAGLFLQSLVYTSTGHYLPAFLASVPALIAAFPITRWFALGFFRIMPKEETEAISLKTFVGKIATITQGQAARGLPAEAKLYDTFGQAHYVRVEPDLDGDHFEQGSEVIIVRQVGSVFRVIKNTSAALSSSD